MADFTYKNISLDSSDLYNDGSPGDVQVTYDSIDADRWPYNAKLKLNTEGNFEIDGDMSNYTGKGENTHIYGGHVEAGTYRDSVDVVAGKGVGTLLGDNTCRTSTSVGEVTKTENFSYNGGASSAPEGAMSEPEYNKNSSDYNTSRKTAIGKIYSIGSYNVMKARDVSEGSEGA